MKIIAIKGKNSSGKSTVAAMLAKKLDEKGISNKVLSFAEPLKKIATELYATPVDWENRMQKDLYRHNLELLADAIKFAFSFNVFAEELLINLGNFWDYKAVEQVAIISDLRFESEYKSLLNFSQEEDELIIIEIKNKLTDNNPPEYDELLIK